jgi:hypothetical protein
MSKSENLPATSRRPRRTPPARIRIKRIQGNVASFASPGPTEQVWREQLKATLGTVSDEFVDMALHHLERAARMPGDGASDMAINGAIAMIAAFAPKNEVEAAFARRSFRPSSDTGHTSGQTDLIFQSGSANFLF